MKRAWVFKDSLSLPSSQTQLGQLSWEVIGSRKQQLGFLIPVPRPTPGFLWGSQGFTAWSPFIKHQAPVFTALPELSLQQEYEGKGSQIFLMRRVVSHSKVSIASDQSTHRRFLAKLLACLLDYILDLLLGNCGFFQFLYAAICNMNK